MKKTQMEMYIVPLDPMGCSFLPRPGVKCNTFNIIDLNDFSRKEKRIGYEFILLIEVIIRDIKCKRAGFSLAEGIHVRHRSVKNAPLDPSLPPQRIMRPSVVGQIHRTSNKNY